MRFARLAAALVAATALLAALDTRGLAQAPPHANHLTGSWRLDRDASSPEPDLEPAPTVRQIGRIGRIGVGVGPSGSDGSRPDGSRPGGSPMAGRTTTPATDPKRAQQARGTLVELLAAREHLAISHDQGTVVVENESAQRERLVADGQNHTHTLQAGDVTNRASWKDGVLRVETTLVDGQRIERRFAVEPAPKATRLVITVTGNLQMSRKPLELTRVYLLDDR